MKVKPKLLLEYSNRKLGNYCPSPYKVIEATNTIRHNPGDVLSAKEVEHLIQKDWTIKSRRAK